MMRRLIIPCALVAVWLASSAPEVSAQQSEAEKQATERDTAARTAFRLGEFDKAIVAWKEAYRFKTHPVFLYNIAQAYRRKEDLPQAIFFYKQYLKEAPNAANKGEVEKRIAELESVLAKNKEASTSPPEEPLDTKTGTGTGTGTGQIESTTTTTGSDKAGPSAGGSTQTGQGATPPTGPVDTVDEEPPGRTKKLIGLGVGGTGVAFVVTSIIFGAKASSAASDVEAAVEAGDPWTDELDDRHSSGKRSATIGKVTLGLGLAAMATGGALFYLGLRDAKSAEGTASIAPSVSPDGVALNLLLRY